jgi:hypothetical protein
MGGLDPTGEERPVTDARSWRTEVTERTGRYAASLGRMPRWLPLAVVAALTLGGLLVGGVLGAALLAVVAVLAGWLAVLRWDELSAGERLVRVLAVALLLVMIARKVLAG